MPEGFRIAKAWVSVSPDTEGFREELEQRLEEAIAGVRASARVSLDLSELDARASEARRRVEELSGEHAEAEVGLDISDLEARASQARERVDEIGESHAEATADLNASDLDAHADEAEARLNAIDGRRVTAHVEADTSELDARVAEARTELDGLSRDSSGRLRDSRGRFAGGGGEGGAEEGGGFFSRIFGSRSGGRSGKSAGGEGGSGLGGVLSGAYDLVPDFLKTATKFTAIGATVAPALGGVAAGAGLLGAAGFAGLGGIASALSAKAQANQTLGLTPQQKQLTSFSNSVADRQAQEQVTNARTQAAQDAITSAHAIEQAQQSLTSVERSAAESQVQALDSVRQAEQGVEEANYGLSEAQYNLNQAWEAARENISQLNDQLADSKLNVQSAQLAIKQAIVSQRQVNENAYSTDLQRQQAALGVVQAQQQLQDAQDQLTSSQYKANLANQEGVDGSQQIIQAKQQLIQAQYGQTDAQAQYADAQMNLRDTELNNAQQIRQAQLDLAATQQQASYQQQVDARTVAEAERNVSDTLKQQQLQLAATASTENEAANMFARDMARLTPAAQNVVNQILGMQGAWRQMKVTAENGIAPGVSVFLDGVSKVLPLISDGVGKMAGLIGQAFSSVGKQLQSSGAGQVLSGLIDNGLKLAQVVAPALGGFVGILLKVGSQKGAIDGLSNLIGGLAGGLSNVMSALSPFVGVISQVFTTLGQALGPVGSLLGTVVGSLVSALAPALQAILPGFQMLVGALGQGLSVALQAIGPLLQPVGEAITAVATALSPLLPTLGGLIAKIATALTPVLQAVVPIIGMLAQLLVKDLQDGLLKFVTAILPILPALAKLIVSLTPLLGLIFQLAGFLLDMSAKILGPVLGALAQLIVWILELASKWRQVVTWIEDAALWLWHNVLDPMWQGIAAGAIWLYQNALLPLYHGFMDVVGSIETGADWLWHHVFDPLYQGITQGASTFISDFSTAWGKLMDVFKTPVNFLITTVYTKGIEELWNGVVGAIGQDSLKLPDIQPFASGGLVPGYAPGQDTVPAMLSPGEGVLVPEAVRALGPGTVLALNAAYGGGRTSTPGHFKGGGIIGGISSAWDSVTGGLSKGLDIAKIAAAVGTGNTAALNNALAKLVGTNAVGNYAKLLLGVPTTLIGDLVKAVVGGKSPGSSGGGTSIPAAVSGSVAQWFASAVQATGAPTAWIPGLETIAHYESGDNPNAINNWDSNAKAGDPSRGLMQTIMSTFLAYHQAGTSSNIYDPVANIAAGINYIKSRYGSVDNVPGIKSLARGGPYVGYDSGGWLMPSGMPVNGLGKPEAVLTPDQSDALIAWAEDRRTQRSSGDQTKQVTIQFLGTQYPTAEQMASIKREMALALG